MTAPGGKPFADLVKTLPRGGNAVYGIIGAGPAHLDPQLSRAGQTLIVSDTVNDWLLRYDLKGNLIPSLATSYQIADEKTLKFSLRTNVKFHNGRPMTPDDVKKTIAYVKDPATKSVYAREMDPIDEVETPTPDSVVLHLSRPSPALLHNLTRIAIIPTEVVKEQGDMKNNPVGAGPFKFKDWQRGTSILVERNPDYWDPDAPRLDSITFRFVPDERSALASFETGEIEIIRAFGAASFKELQNREGEGLHAVMQPTMDYGYLAMNQERKPFDDVRVRKAIMLTLERKAFNDAGHLGFSRLSYFPVPNDSPFYPKDLEYARDVAQAMKLMADAGYADGFESSILVPQFPLEEPYGVVLQNQLKDLNIKLNVEVLQVAPFIEKTLTKRDYEMTMLSDAGSADPATFMDQYLKSDGANNLSNYKNPKMDDLLSKAGSTYADAERAKLYHDAFQLMRDDAVLPIILMYALPIAWRDPVLGQYVLSDPENFRNNWPIVARKAA